MGCLLQIVGLRAFLVVQLLLNDYTMRLHKVQVTK